MSELDAAVQLIKLEIDGMQFFVRSVGTVGIDMAQLFAQMIKKLGGMAWNSHKTKKLDGIVGEVSIKNFRKKYAGDDVLLVELKDVDADNFLDMCQKEGIAITKLPDLNINDGNSQYMVAGSTIQTIKFNFEKINRWHIEGMANTSEPESTEMLKYECGHEISATDYVHTAPGETLEEKAEAFRKVVDGMSPSSEKLGADDAVFSNFKSWRDKRAATSKSFEEAFNHHTENDYSRDNFYIICDRICPDNYIKVRSQRDIYEGKEYTKSLFEIYKDGKKIFECNDGRFKGREKSYWYNLRENMKIQSNMSDDNIIFEKEENFEKYRRLYKVDSEKYVKTSQNQEILKFLKNATDDQRMIVAEENGYQAFRIDENMIVGEDAEQISLQTAQGEQIDIDKSLVFTNDGKTKVYCPLDEKQTILGNVSCKGKQLSADAFKESLELKAVSDKIRAGIDKGRTLGHMTDMKQVSVNAVAANTSKAMKPTKVISKK